MYKAATLAHLESLKSKHEALDNRIQLELQHPSANDLNIRQLKAEKLHLKDKIEEIEHQYN